MARPTHYSDEIVRKAAQYLIDYEDLGHAVPSVSGLSIYLGRPRSTIYQWASEEGKEEFLDILEQINAHQENVALSKGLKGDFNATIVKLLLGKHGYSDKVESVNDHRVSLHEMTDDELNNKLAALINESTFS
jgi:hypothetical protein